MTGTASELYHDQTMISVGMLPTLLRWRYCTHHCDQRTGDCYIRKPLWTFIKYGDHNVWCTVNTSEKYGSADAQSGLVGAASQPGTSTTWQPQRPAGQLSQPRALTCMATAGAYRYSVWTACELYGATSAPQQYLCILLICYGQWSWWRTKHRHHWCPCTGRC